MDSVLLLVAFLLLGIAAWILFRAQRRQDVSSYLVVALWFVLLLWYVIPTLFVAPFIDSDGRLGGFSDTYSELVVIENGAFLCAVAVLLIRRPYFRRVASRAIPPTSNAASGWAILVLVGIGSAVEAVDATLFGDTYLERNAFATTQQDTTMYAAAGTLVFATALATSASIAYLTTGALTIGRGGKRTIPSIVAWGWLAYQSIVPPLRGARIALLLPLVLVAFAAVKSKWSPGRAAKWVAITALTVVAGGATSIVISGTRADGRLSLSTIVADASRVVDSESSGVASALLREITDKFNAPLGGSILLGVEGPARAGLQPFVGAVLSFVPRFVLPDKPVPGSADGTYAGHPTRVAAALLGHDAASGNVQVSPAAKTIWALGYWGMPLMIALNAAYLMFVNSMLLCPLLSRRVLGFFMLGVPAFLTLLSSPDECIQNFIRIGAIALFLATAGAFLGTAVQSRRVRPHSSVAATWQRPS